MWSPNRPQGLEDLTVKAMAIVTITIFQKKKGQILSLALRSLAWLLEGPMGLAKWLCSLWRHTMEITGQIPLCHRSCSLASITLLSRVGMIKLIVFVFQGFLYFKGVVGSGVPGPLLACPGRSSPVHPAPHTLALRICPGEFLTGSPHLSAGKT